MMSTPPTRTLPAYEQVKAFIKQQITTGAWRPGDNVPSEAALQQQFGVSRMTVNRAVKELAVEGLALAAVLHVPPLQSVFETAPLAPWAWPAILLGPVMLLAVDEAAKWRRRRRAPIPAAALG